MSALPLQLEHLLDGLPSESPKIELPPIAEFPRWRVRLARESNPHAAHPVVSQVYDQLELATQWPEPQPHRTPSDPMATLLNRVAGLDEAPMVTAPLQTPATHAMPAVHEGLALALGRELLALTGSSALNPQRRAEAVEATVIALANPTRENVQAILLALIRD